MEKKPNRKHMKRQDDKFFEAEGRTDWKSKKKVISLDMTWAAKRPANEPSTGLFSGPLTAQFYLLFPIGLLTSRYQFLKSLSTFIFQLNVVERS